MIIGSIVILLLLVGGIYLYKTYALYEEKKEFNVLKGIIPNFSKTSIVALINGKNVAIPSKNSGYKVAQVSCDKGATAIWDNQNWKLKITKITDKEITCTVIFAKKFSEYISDLNTSDSSVVKMEHKATNQTPALTDYRYVGKNPNNYVCFGSEEETCPEDNLYRIIGLIPTRSSVDGNFENRIKLIKNENYNETKSGLCKSSSRANGGYGYIWSSINSYWGTSSLNNEVLNKVYWNSLGEYQKYIDPAVWYLGYGSVITTPIQIYQYERNSTAIPVSGAKNYFIANIGIMYPTDYSFATAGGQAVNRETCLTGYNMYPGWHGDCTSNDWLFDGYNQHLLFPEGSMNTTDCAVEITSNGILFANQCNSGGIYSRVNGVRPSFYLKENVMIVDGNGTLENPYRIAFNE